MKPLYIKWLGGLLLLILSLPRLHAQTDTLCNPNEIKTIFGEAYFIYGGVTNSYSTFNRSDVTAIQVPGTVSPMISRKHQMGLGQWVAWQLPPQAPTLQASQGDFKDRILLKWEVNPLGPNPTSFIINRDGSFLTELGSDVRQFIDFFTQAGEYYEYSIVGKNSFGEGSTYKSIGFMNPNGVVSGKIESNSGNPVPDVEVRLTPLTGSSLAFDGIDDQMCVSYEEEFPTEAFTVSAYVKLGAGNNEAGIIDWGSSLNKNWWITTTKSDEAKGYIFHIGNGTGSDSLKYYIPNEITNPELPNQWHQITLVYNGTAMSVMVDGNFVGTKPSIISRTKNLLNIGSKIGGSGYMNGLIDDVRIYNRPLTQTEINSTKNRTVSQTEKGLITYFKMDEGIGTKVFDNTIIPTHASIYGGASFSSDIPEVYNAGISDVTGYYSIDGINYSTIESFRVTPIKNFEYNSAIEFNAADKSYGNLTNYDIPDTSTIEVLFHPFDLESRQTVLSKGDLYELYIDNSSLFLNLNGSVSDLGPIKAKYYHVAVAIDNNAGTAEVYLEGELSKTVSFTGTSNWEAGNIPWLIGTNSTVAGTGKFYTGLIDEVAIYKTALPLTQIQTHFVTGIPQDSSTALLYSYFDLNEGSDTKVYDYSAINFGAIIPREGILTKANWSNNARRKETNAHEFEPNIRVVNLNNSNTAIGNVDFKDVSTVSVSGAVRFNNTFCFVDQVEILVNNESYFPPIYTDAEGKWSADFEPGASVQLKAEYKDHLFTPSFMEFRKLQSPKAGIVFLDNTKRTISGQLAGGLCRKTIIPDAGNVVVKVATLDGCFTKTDTIRNPNGKFNFTDLPARAFSVTVEEHPVSDIFGQLALKGVSVDLRDSAKATADFIYFSPPNIELQPFELVTCYPTAFIVQSESVKSPKYKKKIKVYQQYGFLDLPGDRCYLDNAVLTINNAIQGSNEEVIQMDSTTYVYEFLASTPNIISPYTKTIDVRANVNGEATTVTEDVIVLGRRSRETTFTTDAPSDKPLWILRDPPGDASFATLESGSTKCEVYGNSQTSSTQGSLSGSVEIGKKVTTFLGLGAGVIEENGAITTVGMTGSVNYQGGSSGETEVCYTNTNAYSTSDGDDVVGRMADVFIGTSMNFEYGINDIIYFDAETCEIKDTVNVFIDPKRFGTEYVYSRFQIMTDVIPTLESLASVNPSEDYDKQADRWRKILQEDEYYLKPKGAPSSSMSDLINSVLSAIPDSDVIPEDLISEVTNLIETDSDFAVPGLEFSAGTANGPDTIRYVPIFDKNVTFDGLSNYTSTFSKSDKSTTTTSWELGSEFQTTVNTEITVFSIDVNTTIETTTGSNFESTSSNSTEKTTTISYTLADDDVGDNFTIDIFKKSNMPVFSLKAGESSCPWEYGTLNIQEVGVKADRLSQVNVPSNVQATFPIHLQNIGQRGADPMVVLIGEVANSNPNGAILSINGSALTQPLTFQIDANEELDLLLTIQKGPIDYDYNDLKIFLTTECQYQHSLSLGYILANGLGYLVDETGVIPGFDASKYDGLNEKFYKELSFDVSFIEPCSPVDISFPQQNFVVTPGSNNVLSITLDEYNISDEDLEKITLLYRPDGAASWIKIEEILKEDLGPLFETYSWNTALLKDGTYEIKAVAQCTSVNLAPGESTIIRGKLERQPPVLVGLPQPSDGIWDPGDEISITFNEAINCDVIYEADVLGNNTIGLYDATTDALVAANFTCFGNKIVIVPTINPSDFENRFFRVQVSGKDYDDIKFTGNPSHQPVALRDKAGNMIPETIKWEFAVNQNDLEWIGTDIIESNTVLEPFSVKRQVGNRGGTIASFRMEDIPSWLTVSPATGTLNPGQTADITFTFQTDLLIGDYTATPNLVGSKGAEPMGIDYRVRCEAPSYAVENLTEYEGSMTMVIDLSIFDVHSTDPSDIVIAKIDGEIRGVGQVNYYRDIPKDMVQWLSFMTIHGNSDDVGKPIEINVWDGDKCNEYVEVLQEFTYQEGDFLGSILEPQPIQILNLVKKCIPLNRGWNWVSFNLDLGDGNNTISNVLSSLKNKEGTVIKSDNSNARYYGSPINGWKGTLTSITPQKRYMFNVAQKDTVCIKGAPYATDDFPIDISAGWNWVGYVPSTGMTVTQALAGLTPLNGDFIKSQTLFAQYIAGAGWIGSLSFLEPLKGYLMKISNSGTLIYPTGSTNQINRLGEISSTEIASQKALEAPMTFDFTKYQLTMNLIGQVNGIGIDSNDELRAYIDGQLVGVNKSISYAKDRLFFQTIYYQDESLITFKLYKADIKKEYSLNRTMPFAAETVAGMVDNPIVFELTTTDLEPIVFVIEDQMIWEPNRIFMPVSVIAAVSDQSVSCGSFTFNSTLPSATDAKPVCVAQTGLEGNMIGIIRINYSELSTFASVNDVLSVIDPITGSTVGCGIYESPDNVFNITIGGNVSSIETPLDIRYYSSFMKKSFLIKSGVLYKNNKELGDYINPVEIDVSPLVINVDNGVITAVLQDTTWIGTHCVEAFALNCPGFSDGQTTICFQRLKSDDCLEVSVRNTAESANKSIKAVSISSEAIINSGVRINYIGGNKIELTPGFETKPGTVFSSKIEGCEN